MSLISVMSALFPSALAAMQAKAASREGSTLVPATASAVPAQTPAAPTPVRATASDARPTAGPGAAASPGLALAAIVPAAPAAAALLAAVSAGTVGGAAVQAASSAGADQVDAGPGPANHGPGDLIVALSAQGVAALSQGLGGAPVSAAASSRAPAPAAGPAAAASSGASQRAFAGPSSPLDPIAVPSSPGAPRNVAPAAGSRQQRAAAQQQSASRATLALLASLQTRKLDASLLLADPDATSGSRSRNSGAAGASDVAISGRHPLVQAYAESMSVE